MLALQLSYQHLPLVAARAGQTLGLTLPALTLLRGSKTQWLCLGSLGDKHMTCFTQTSAAGGIHPVPGLGSERQKENAISSGSTKVIPD